MTEAEMLLASRPCQAEWYAEDPLSRAKKTRLPSLLQQYSLWLSIRSDLLHHRELVPIVPAFHDLAVANANHRHSCDSDRLAARRNAQMVSLVRHRGGPTNHCLVAYIQSSGKTLSARYLRRSFHPLEIGRASCRVSESIREDAAT